MGNAGSYKLSVVGHGEYEGAVAFLKFSITPVKSANFDLNVKAVDYDPRGFTFEEG